jgi:hypothetical protein
MRAPCFGERIAVPRHHAQCASAGELVIIIRELLERSQMTGIVRLDVSSEHVLAMVSALCIAVKARSCSTETRCRLVDILCDGLRPQPGAQHVRRGAA